MVPYRASSLLARPFGYKYLTKLTQLRVKPLDGKSKSSPSNSGPILP